jgi:hypothetical protein
MMGPEATQESWDSLLNDEDRTAIEIDDDIQERDIDRDLQIWHQKHRDWHDRDMDEPITIEVTMTRRRWKEIADIIADHRGFHRLQQEILEDIDHPTLQQIITAIRSTDAQ